jgi:hypothetical protein
LAALIATWKVRDYRRRNGNEEERVAGKQTCSAADRRENRRARRLAGQDAEAAPYVIKEADPDVVEEWKWSVPVWSHDGLICTGETYKKVVKMTFAKGAALKDPSSLFNSSLEGNTRRAIDFHEGGKINEEAFTTLIRAAVTLNKSVARR